ncbi:ATP-binding protein [Bosea sp. TWI1241]|uniref:AlbA family DNA-binding domain-containing protein n=1 Tax=Bosea sp. TWI1241 TaxID=3148904 RepID=UPI00320809B3
MTDEEIGLIKAMLAEGIKNDAVHFYFNRADRLLSSGRITQIKQGKYGAAVPAASRAETAAFIADWKCRQLAGAIPQAAHPTDAATVTALFELIEGSWALRLGETDKAECKLGFRLDPLDRFADVIRTIAGFANNKGGYVLFGVRDGTRIAEGLQGNAFIDADPAAINRALIASLDPVPHVTKTTLVLGGAQVGVLYVEPHDHAPVVALRNISDCVKEGAIYYRYVGETRLIKPGELRQIIASREQRAVAEFSQRMMRVAGGTEATLNLDTGAVTGKAGAFVIDRDLLPALQFIRQGDFSEVKGAPALRLVGDVEAVDQQERDRIRIIRDAVTPDAVVRNFLRGEVVAHPDQYLHAQAHGSNKWLPIWYYLRQANMAPQLMVAELQGRVATHPSSRDAVVRRLQQADSALKVHPGRPAQLRDAFARGEVVAPTNVTDDLRFAYAVMGLLPTQQGISQFKPLLLACLDRAQGQDASSGNRRSAVYRAACRLDELLHG